MTAVSKNLKGLADLLIWKTFELAIVIAAAAILLWKFNSIFAYLEIIGLFMGLAVITVLTLFIKQRGRRRAVSLILVLLMSAAAVGAAYYEMNGKTLFRRYVADPVPGSVRILNSKYWGGMDPAVFLHFETSPADFEAVLQKRPYAIKPDWWRPQSLENATIYYWEKKRSDPGRQPDIAWIWVNESKTEVYFAYWNF